MIGIPRPQLPFLYRARSAGWLMGVCAGVADLTGIKTALLRSSFVVGTFFYPVATIVIYLLLVIFLRDKADGAGAASGPGRPAGDQQKRLAAARAEYLEMRERLASLEGEAVSREAELRKRFHEAGLS